MLDIDWGFFTIQTFTCSVHTVTNILKYDLLFDIPDIRGINSIAVQAVNSGMIIVGGGVVKHHTANANLMVSLL